MNMGELRLWGRLSPLLAYSRLRRRQDRGAGRIEAQAE